MVEYPLLAEAAADGVTTVLDGQGGDELFAVSGFLIADRVAHGRLLSSLRLTRRLPGARGRSDRQLIEAWRYYVQGGLAPYRLHAALKERRARRSDRWPWLTRASQRAPRLDRPVARVEAGTRGPDAGGPTRRIC